MTIVTPDSARPTSATVLARQPIVDRSGACHGYELLFRGGSRTDDTFDSGQATAGVLVAAACDIGWERLGSGHPLYLNVGDSLLFDTDIELTPPEATVLEVVESMVVDDRLIERLTELRGRGYGLALDDFVPGSPAERLVALVDVVKVDVLATPQTAWVELVARLHDAEVLVVAEKVESQATHEAAMIAGFDLFQGYWYARPAVQRSMSMTPQRAVCLRLLGLLVQDDPSTDEIENLVTSDAALAVRTLRMANSAAVGASRSIGSLRQAIVMVGPRTLAGWVALMVMAQDRGDDPVVATEVLVHARTCEIVVASTSPDLSGAAFLCGLALGLVERAGLQPRELLDTLGASDDIRAALLERTGPLGAVIEQVGAHLSGREPDAGLSIQLAHLAAVAWVSELRRLA